MQKVKLGDMCESIFAGGDVPLNRWAKQKNNLYNIPIYTNGEKNNGLYGYTTEAKINKPCVTISARGTIGYSVIRKEPFYPAIRLITVIPKSDCLDLGYLCNYLNLYPFSKSGTSIPQLTVPDVKNLVLYLPDLNQQKSISKRIDKINQIISYRKCQLEKLDELIKSQFIEMFGDININPYRLHFDLLGKVCDVRDGTHDSPAYYSTGFPLVTSKNVINGKIDISNCSLICEEDFNKINIRSKVDKGDIIMPMIGTVGNPAIVDIEPNFAIKNVALIKFNNSTVLNSFIMALLCSDYFDKNVMMKVRGGTQKFISLGDIRNLKIYIPPIELQNKFDDFVERVDLVKTEIKQSLAQLVILKKSLMQKYFG